MFRRGAALLLLTWYCSAAGCGLADFWMPEPKANRCPANCHCPDCQATSSYGAEPSGEFAGRPQSAPR